MPTAYGGGKMSFNRKVGKWEKVSTEKAFDYENVDPRSAALLISFFRYSPIISSTCFAQRTHLSGLSLCSGL